MEHVIKQVAGNMPDEVPVVLRNRYNETYARLREITKGENSAPNPTKQEEERTASASGKDNCILQSAVFPAEFAAHRFRVQAAIHRQNFTKDCI
ncbi:hypothetical protein NDS46_05555 [Paenibacillus thiaminolyticus]|uniref:hypothetical protein n=1 Tax=Paenibacillus thiaminolyticus TaxID=49283 RepID=UPI00232F80FF|nr:hypothetical protein [Paenibacillus thiaminolyticus]WCF09364.1 hypothetical protein NDS46_05555 [Paenibacillus thiaminolyticus]